MIEVGNIVTLENGQDYLLLEELEQENRKFVYAVRVLEDETPTDEFLIFECFYDGDAEYMKAVSNKEEYDALIENFKDLVAEKLLQDDEEGQF